MPSKELIQYWRTVWTNEPTELDKHGCDGLYIKEIAPSASPNKQSTPIKCKCGGTLKEAIMCDNCYEADFGDGT